jgi:hypothetical protein
MVLPPATSPQRYFDVDKSIDPFAKSVGHLPTFAFEGLSFIGWQIAKAVVHLVFKQQG